MTRVVYREKFRGEGTVKRKINRNKDLAIKEAKYVYYCWGFLCNCMTD